MRWPFRRRKPGPRVIIEDWSVVADWRVGDLAVCIQDDWPIPFSCNPRKDEVLRVAKVAPAMSYDHSTRFIGLGFESKPPDHLWSNNAFRKAHLAHEPASESLYEMIRRRSRRRRR